jgi:hypothetical protein
MTHFQILQGFTAQAQRAGFRMKDARGNPDLQRALHHAASGFVGQGAQARLDQPESLGPWRIFA